MQEIHNKQLGISQTYNRDYSYRRSSKIFTKVKEKRVWRKSEIVRDGERDRKRNVDIEQDSVATGVSFLSYVC